MYCRHPPIGIFPPIGAFLGLPIGRTSANRRFSAKRCYSWFANRRMFLFFKLRKLGHANVHQSALFHHQHFAVIGINTSCTVSTQKQRVQMSASRHFSINQHYSWCANWRSSANRPPCPSACWPFISSSPSLYHHLWDLSAKKVQYSISQTGWLGM